MPSKPKDSKSNFEFLNVSGELIVDKNELNKPVMKILKLKIEITSASNKKKADLLIKKTLDNGFILQSVKTEVLTEVTYL